VEKSGGSSLAALVCEAVPAGMHVADDVGEHARPVIRLDGPYEYLSA